MPSLLYDATTSACIMTNCINFVIVICPATFEPELLKTSGKKRQWYKFVGLTRWRFDYNGGRRQDMRCNGKEPTDWQYSVDFVQIGEISMLMYAGHAVFTMQRDRFILQPHLTRTIWSKIRLLQGPHLLFCSFRSEV